MSQEKIYLVAELGLNNSHLNRESYERLYKKSIEFPEKFWSEQAEELLSWHEPWGQVKRGDFKDASNQWFPNAKLNVSYNCIDR